LVVGIIGFSGFATSVYAQTNTKNDSNGNFFSGLVQAIAQKFHLDENQVKATVDDYHQQKRKERKENMGKKEEDRLSQLVKDGKITDAQKQAILSKLASLKQKYNPANMKDKTPEERKKQMQSMKDELTSWAKSQGIDINLIFPKFEMGAGMGRKWMHMGTKPN